MIRKALSAFADATKSALLAGVLVLAPLGITIWVFFSLVDLADGIIRLLPEQLRPSTYLGFPIPGLGVLVTLTVVTLVGYGMRYYTGRRVVELYEALLRRVPVANGIYHGLKQLIETVFSQKGRHFREVVLVEYPRRGVYCLAFLTNEHSFLKLPTPGAESGAEEAELISVFLPTTPNPTSGFYLLLPREDVMRLELSVEEAFKLIMSAGIVMPGGVRQALIMGKPKPEAASTEDAGADQQPGEQRTSA